MSPVTNQILTFLLGAATLHGIFLSLLLFLKNRKSTPHLLLALSLFAISLYLSNYLLFLTEIILHLPHLLGVLGPAIYLVGPAFYFFVTFSLRPSFRWRTVHLVHLLPFVHSCWRSIRLFQVEEGRKLAYIEQLLGPHVPDFSGWDLFMATYVTLLLLGYIIAAWWQGKLAASRNEYVHIGQWLSRFSLGFGTLIISDLVLKITAFVMEIPAFVMEYVLASMTAVAIHVAGYFALGNFPRLKPLSKKYKTSSLNPQQIHQYQKRLLDLLETDQPWLEPSLKIADLAAQMGIPSHQLSQVLSEGLHTSFFDLIHQYRIAEIKRRLVHPDYQRYSILAIALDCGFNSKATFNRVFKQVTGMTPSAYVGGGEASSSANSSSSSKNTLGK